jgi:hypothetical protein
MMPARPAEWASLPGAVPLRRTYDAERLATEVRSLQHAPWRAQRAFGQDGVISETELDWRILSLRSLGGDAHRTDPGGAGMAAFADTAHLSRAPYLAEVLASIPAPLRSVRLMALGPGVRVHEHRDGKCGFPWGAMRLHVPVITNPGAVVVIGGAERHWEAGRLWFGDFDRLHYVRNSGRQPRIHLVIDCMVTLELLELFPGEYIDRLPRRDVLVARPAVPLGRTDRDALRCTVAMPAAFPEWSEEKQPDEAAPDVAASVDVMDDRLVLLADAEPLFSLVHIGTGEFRFEGWTEERTLHIDLSPPAPQVRFRVRQGHVLTEWVRPAVPALGDAAQGPAPNRVP